MRLEASINGVPLHVEVPSGASVEKGGVARAANPDEVLTNVSAAVRLVAAHLGRALEMEAYVPPVAMEVRFSVRIDDKAFVSIGTTPADGQFLVTLKYDA